MALERTKIFWPIHRKNWSGVSELSEFSKFLCYRCDISSNLYRLQVTHLDIDELNQVSALIRSASRSFLAKNAFDCLESSLSKNVIPTLSNSIDELLDGGLQIGRMYQFFGESGVGKSQLW